LFSVV